MAVAMRHPCAEAKNKSKKKRKKKMKMKNKNFLDGRSQNTR